jgi:hypothetical protein
MSQPPFARRAARFIVGLGLLGVGLAACSSGGKSTTGAGGGSGAAGATGSAGAGGAPVGAAGSGAAGARAGAPGTAGGTGGNVDAAIDGVPPRPDAATDSREGGATDAPATARFSFFETSLVAMRRLSKSQNGFGGDLTYGQADGLAGADKICTEVAETSMPGAGAKGWRAFLSVASGPGGAPVNAIDRLGSGPWYDRLGRVVALTKAALLNPRPMGADPAILNDLPNEDGLPNHRPDLTMPEVDNHHVLTGSDPQGRLYGATATCASWTSTAPTAGRPRIGFSWIASTRVNWISGQDEGGCGAGVNTVETGGSNPNNPIVGSGGGYGAIYCFAAVP